MALNTKKTKGIIEDFRKTGQFSHSPLFIGKEEVERVSDFKFLGLTATEDLLWGKNSTLARGRAQKRLFDLRKLKRLMVNFYYWAVQSVLKYGLVVWFSSCTEAEQQARRRVVKSAGKIIGTSLLEITTVHTSRCLHRVHNILQDR